jgi:hypothetical protein
MTMADQLIETFQGTKGKAEVFEVVSAPSDSPGALAVEQVLYEIRFNGERHVAQSMGEASILASELAGDPRFRRL